MNLRSRPEINGALPHDNPQEWPTSDPMLKILARSRDAIINAPDSTGSINLSAREYPITRYYSYTLVYFPKEKVIRAYDKDGILEQEWACNQEPENPSLRTAGFFVNFRAQKNKDNIFRLDGTDQQYALLPVSKWHFSREVDANRQDYDLYRLNDHQYARACFDKQNTLTILQSFGDYNRSVIFEDIQPRDIEDNLCGDPTATDVRQTGDFGIIYYCVAKSPEKICRVEVKGGNAGHTFAKGTSKPGLVLEQRYKQLNALKHLPANGVFMAEADGGLVFIDDQTGEELHRVSAFSHIHYEDDKVRGLDTGGHLIVAELDLSMLTELKEAKARARALKAIRIGEVVAEGRSRVANVVSRQLDDALSEYRVSLESHFFPIIDNAAHTMAGIADVDLAIAAARASLASQKLAPADIDALMKTIDEKLLEKKRSIVSAEMQSRMSMIGNALQRGITLANLASVQSDIAQVRAQANLLTAAQVTELEQYEDRIVVEGSELYRREASTIKQDMVNFSAAINARLITINGNKAAFDKWYASEWPREQLKLRSLLAACPAGATEAYALIRDAITSTNTQVENARVRFEQEYEAVREVAVARQDHIAGIIETDVDTFITRLDAQQFTDPAQAQIWVSSQEQYKLIVETISGLRTKDAARATELEHQLLSRVASTLDRKRRMDHVGVAVDGHRTIKLGTEEFPIWERKLTEKDKPKVNVSVEFQAEHGQGAVKPNERLGKVMVGAIATGREKVLVDLWQDHGSKADTMRLGLVRYRGADLSPSVMSVTEFKKFQAHLTDWNKGAASVLRKTDGEFRARIHAKHNERKRPDLDGKKQALNPMDDTWRADYQLLLEQYGQFCQENHIILLRQVDRVRKDLEAGESAQSIGAVPKWQSHWVMDRETETMLGELAQALKMQMRLQEGIANLKGHAGTGKDVLVKMLCNLANRPYFAFDCSKWTTEYELAEDVQLVAEHGVTTTIRVPSAVLLALQTPGAVLYLNEFNAMPEQAQIFLHSLLDEKRTMTIKTRSGATVKADPSVLFVSSMNPGYPGTFDPQMATRSRTVPIEVKYPALKNPDGTYSSSEAWRIARGLESLFRLTLTGDSTNNAFVKVWDREMNNKAVVGTPTLDKVQEFDLKVIAALVQFGDKLREAFMQQYDKGSRAPGSKTLKVVQPLTGREMRRFADRLNQMPAAEKITADAEATAKALIEALFLPHLDNVHDRKEVTQAMATWTVKKI